MKTWLLVGLLALSTATLGGCHAAEEETSDGETSAISTSKTDEVAACAAPVSLLSESASHATRRRAFKTAKECLIAANDSMFLSIEERAGSPSDAREVFEAFRLGFNVMCRYGDRATPTEACLFEAEHGLARILLTYAGEGSADMTPKHGIDACQATFEEALAEATSVEAKIALEKERRACFWDQGEAAIQAATLPNHEKGNLWHLHARLVPDTALCERAAAAASHESEEAREVAPYACKAELQAFMNDALRALL
jgi:hypothetical protein